MDKRNPDKLIADLISGDPLSRRKRAFVKQHILQTRRPCTELELRALDLLGVNLTDVER